MEDDELAPAGPPRPARGGLRNVWFKALGETVYRRLLSFEFRLAEPPPRIPSEVPLDLEFLTPSDADEYARLRPDAPPEVVARRFDGGERCFVGWHDGRLVSARWLATGDVYVDYLRCWIRLAPGVRSRGTARGADRRAV